jgi:DNA repair photolyase
VDDDADPSLIRRFRNRFPGLRIVTGQNTDASHRPSSRNGIRLVRHNGAFIKPFPNHPWYGTSGCDHSLILGYNCFCACAYCFIQTIFKDTTPTLYTNTGQMISELEAFLTANPTAWVSTGEYLDSFQLDDVTRANDALADVFQNFPDSTLELRTKIDNVSHLPAGPPGNILVSWSINPPAVIERVEPGTAALERRLELATALIEKGYRVAFRIDPIIPTDAFAGGYEELPALVQNKIGWETIDRVFLGALRFDDALLKRMSVLPHASLLLDAEYVRCPDGNHRPQRHVRTAAYRSISSAVRRHAPRIPITLTMEPEYVRRAVT